MGRGKALNSEAKVKIQLYAEQNLSSHEIAKKIGRTQNVIHVKAKH